MSALDLSWATALDGLDLGQAGHWPLLPALLLLVAVCVAIVVIDWRERIIPNACNAVVAALGFALALRSGGCGAAFAAVAQGAAIFALFWAARALYQALRSKTGLGLGDVKFLGAAGLWVGLAGVPPLILVACTTALAYVGIQHWRGQAITAQHAIPFGPFLVLGFAAVLGGALLGA